MTIPQELSSSARSSRGGEAASLSLIKLRRADRAAAAITKTTDLTHRLRRPPANAPQIVVMRESRSSDSPLLPVAPALNPPPLETSPASSNPPAADKVVDTPAAADLAPAVHVAPPPARPLEQPAAAETARGAPLPNDDVQDGKALLGYWDRLRGARALPLFASLDPSRIAASWPDSLMVNYSGGNMARPQITRLSRHTGEVEYTSMVTDWILSCSQQAARTGKPMEKEEDFPLDHGSKSYRMLLLPFSSAGATGDYVLCHLRYID